MNRTDVEDITDSAGDAKATYGYTAYGQNNDAETTGIDKPDPADPTKEPYNAFRYEAKRWDPNSGTYDMGFRDYNPGLNQFLNRDTYNGALADQDLATDPFTANRYAFTGGNPVSNIELDGHEPCPSGKKCDYLYTGDPKLTDQAKATRQSLLDTAADKWTGNGAAFKHGDVNDVHRVAQYMTCQNDYPGTVGRVCGAMLDHGESLQDIKYFLQHPQFFLPQTGDKSDFVLPWKKSAADELTDTLASAAFMLLAGPAGAEGDAAEGEGVRCNSFVRGTKILMADGSYKSIERVKAGDKIKATDPKTGKTTAKKVLASFGGGNYDHLVKVTIDTDGKRHHRTAVIIATEHHLFWNQASGKWVWADGLKPGMKLRTPDGKLLLIVQAARFAGHSAVRDLTVSDYHTFYVAAGSAPVLVHNAPKTNSSKYTKIQQQKDGWISQNLGWDTRVARLDEVCR